MRPSFIHEYHPSEFVLAYAELSTIETIIFIFPKVVSFARIAIMSGGA